MMTLPAPYYQDGSVTIYHARCEDVLPVLDLSEVAMVLADPPYGIGIQSSGGGAKSNSTAWKTGKAYPSKIDGDDQPFTPPESLLAMLGSATVVLWGGNHFSAVLPSSRGWLVWDKRPREYKGLRFAEVELAWTNRDANPECFRFQWSGSDRGGETCGFLHPTQKPVALMKWCLALAKLPTGALVLDPYTGSGPVLAAAKQMGYRAIGIDSLEWCCARAAERCRQDVLPLLAADPDPEEPEQGTL